MTYDEHDERSLNRNITRKEWDGICEELDHGNAFLLFKCEGCDAIHLRLIPPTLFDDDAVH
jgi:hypothetical protein